MKRYEKPIVTINDNLAEGVYAASGSDCYIVGATQTQGWSENGNEVYVFQIDATHTAPDHHSTQQVLTLTFNQPVTVQWTDGTLIGGNGTSVITIQYNYHNNVGTEYIGGASVRVASNPGLATPVCSLSCNKTCAEHDGLGNY